MMTTMASKLTLGFACALLAGTLIAPVVAAGAQEGAAERAGEALDNAGRNIRRGVQNAFARSRASVHEQEVLARVYSRIHWDKMLVGSTLQMEVRDDGTAILRGAVPTKASKDRAVALARDTVGVTQVVDELTVLPPPRVSPAPTATETRTTTVIKP